MTLKAFERIKVKAKRFGSLGGSYTGRYYNEEEGFDTAR
jgi:hypothetical protein